MSCLYVRRVAEMHAFVGHSGGARPGTARSSAPLVGKNVRVGGLGSRPDLNGAPAVAESFNAETGRYNLRLVSSGERLAVLPANLQRVPA